MKAYWEVEAQLHPLTSALDGAEWSASRLCCFTPRERAPGTHWLGSWVGPRAILDAVPCLIWKISQGVLYWLFQAHGFWTASSSSSIPFGGCARCESANNSFFWIGKMTVSLNSWITSSRPAMSAHDTGIAAGSTKWPAIIISYSVNCNTLLPITHLLQIKYRSINDNISSSK